MKAASDCRVLLALLLLAAACSSSDRPTAPEAGAAFGISDALHEGGTPGFFFLPPMVAQPVFSGTFDADIAALNPQITIFDLATGATTPVVVFTTTSTPAITLDPTTPQYQVNWDTQGSGFLVGHTYRVHVT